MALVNSIRDEVKGTFVVWRDELETYLPNSSEVRGLSPKAMEPFIMSLSSKRPLLDDIFYNVTVAFGEMSE